MIAPMLPRIARDLSGGVSAAGQLMTVFAFFYAVSASFTAALTGHFNHKYLLMSAMTVFCATNLLATCWRPQERVHYVSTPFVVPNTEKTGAAYRMLPSRCEQRHHFRPVNIARLLSAIPAT
jgi:MFS family permease